MLGQLNLTRWDTMNVMSQWVILAEVRDGVGGEIAYRGGVKLAVIYAVGPFL